MIQLKQDSRDVHVKDYFGQVTVVDDFEFDVGKTNPYETAGATDCTAIDTSDVCTDQTGIIYDEFDFWMRTPKASSGADPRDAMGLLIKEGIQPLTGGPRDNRWISYMRCEGNSGDYFETTRQSMLATKSSSMTNTRYCREWLDTPDDGVVPEGKTWISNHSYKISGCRMTPTGLQFHMKDWTGKRKWMPKEVYNIELDKYGTSAFIPTTKEFQKVQLNLIHTTLDIIMNIVLKLQQSIKLFISQQHV